MQWSPAQLRLAKAQDRLNFNARVVAEIAAACDSAGELEDSLQPTTRLELADA